MFFPDDSKIPLNAKHSSHNADHQRYCAPTLFHRGYRYIAPIKVTFHREPGHKWYSDRAAYSPSQSPAFPFCSHHFQKGNDLNNKQWPIALFFEENSLWLLSGMCWCFAWYCSNSGCPGRFLCGESLANKIHCFHFSGISSTKFCPSVSGWLPTQTIPAAGDCIEKQPNFPASTHFRRKWQSWNSAEVNLRSGRSVGHLYPGNFVYFWSTVYTVKR